MASRYWVGGNGTWDTTLTSNWAATSGGASGASAPTSVDDAFFDAASGAAVVTLGENVAVLKLTMTGFTGTLAFQTNKISLHGNGATIYTGATTFTVTGTPVIEAVYSGASGTRTLAAQAATEANSISFNVTAGTDSVNLNGNLRNVDFSGFAGTFVVGTATKRFFGNFKLPAGLTVTGGAAALSFAATSGTKTIELAGNVLDGDTSFNGVGGTWRLEGAFAVGSTRTLSLINGSLDTNNKNVSCGSFSLGAGTKTLALGSGTWTVSGASWNLNSNSTGLTFVGSSVGTINMTSASAKTFAGGARTYPTLNQGGAGALTIQQSNTFANITNTVQPATITLTSGTTQTVTAFTVSGTAGNLITLNASTPGSRATLTDDSNVNSVSYVNITDIAAAGSSEWDAYTSNGNVDGGNNTGWVFTAPPPLTASEYQISLKSFTERRSF